MSLAIVYSRASAGIAAPLVTVEVHLSFGLPKFFMVGLAEAAVKESKDRVRSALMNSHFEFPGRHITVNLAPADLPKEGGRFDLPIAIGILAASGQLPRDILTQYEFTGELALSGELRSIRGVLPMVLSANQSGRQLIVPEQNAPEAALVTAGKVLCANHLLEVCAHLKGETKLSACVMPIVTNPIPELDLADVKGQPQAKRALEIAAAGKHSLLFLGPPGTGKTMLAMRLPSILPVLNDEQAREVAAIASVSNNGFDPSKWKELPFRSPHHSSSHVALVGGGRPPKPGEISLAHHGVLFLDELPEFQRQGLESLREPLEAGQVTISRASFQTIFPAKFQLIAAMNPCPCGYAGSSVECRCSMEQIKRYRGKISGPLLDRIDMHIEVPRLPPEMLAKAENYTREKSAIVRERVCNAHSYQLKRQGKYNTALTVQELEQVSVMEKAAEKLLEQMMTKFHLSARVYHRIIKLARTIADLEETQLLTIRHLSEALNYRYFDRTKDVISR